MRYTPIAAVAALLCACAPSPQRLLEHLRALEQIARETKGAQTTYCAPPAPAAERCSAIDVCRQRVLGTASLCERAISDGRTSSSGSYRTAARLCTSEFQSTTITCSAALPAARRSHATQP